MRIKGGKPLKGLNSLGGEFVMVELVLKAFNLNCGFSEWVFSLDSQLVQLK